MTEIEYKRTSALCTGCGTANPPHDLWEGRCLKCVGKELADERQKREQAERKLSEALNQADSFKEATWQRIEELKQEREALARAKEVAK